MQTKLNKTLKSPWFYVALILTVIVVIFTVNSFGSVFTRKVVSQIDNSVSGDEDYVLGDENAPITIIEYSDYECPFCGRFFNDAYQALKKEYIETGKVKLIFRDFPLSFHQNAQKAAEAAECAGEQGKYYEMHDMIFENQQSIRVSNLKSYAKDIGLDGNQFNQCLDSGKYRNEVQKDFRAGQVAGVQGTPTFFVNGRELVGAQPFSAFQQIIEEELRS